MQWNLSAASNSFDVEAPSTELFTPQSNLLATIFAVADISDVVELTLILISKLYYV